MRILSVVFVFLCFGSIRSQCNLAAPTVSGSTSLSCGQQTTLQASGQGNSFAWFDAASGGNFLGGQSSYTTGTLISDTTFFYVETRSTTLVTQQWTSPTSTSWTVPSGVFSIEFEVEGAQGGSLSPNNGGLGGRVTGVLSVVPGTVLYINVGGQPSNYLGGVNGGGQVNNTHSNGRGGGGASDIRIGGTALNNRVVVAGGGGGSGRNSTTAGQHGGVGGLVGGNGLFNNNFNFQYSGTGATPNQPGVGYPNATSGALGQGGNGGYNATTRIGGGGGGGWFGGGGGWYYGGGGGGSSFANSSIQGVVYSSGVKSGHGRIWIRYASVSCASLRTQVAVTADSALAPVLTGQSTLNCGQTTSLTATASGSLFQWMDSPLGGNVLGTGSLFVTPMLTHPTTYYVRHYSMSNSMQTQTFNYTGSGQSFVVPSDVYSLQVDISGAQGGNYSTITPGGLGGRVRANMSVVPGETLWVYVGLQPNNITTGGWNGGGNGVGNGRGGGGASDIRRGGTSVHDRVLVAGGGGGAGAGGCGGQTDRGGNAGGTGNAENGWYCNQFNTTYCGYAATQTAGGQNNSANTGAGMFFQGGNGNTTGSGGGGGGWFGGGGARYYAGGGGGSSYTQPGTFSSVQHEQGYKMGNGQVVIRWASPVCYSPLDSIFVVVDTNVSAPIVTGNTSIVCGQNTVLSATGTGNALNWYGSLTGGTLIGTGGNYTTPILLSTDTVYVETVTSVSGSQTFNFSGAPQWFIVPAGVTSLQFNVLGARGGNANGTGWALGGLGGRVQGSLSVTPGQVLYLYVGGVGINGDATNNWKSGGWNGGGMGFKYAGGGGGASDIRTTIGDLNSRLVVAGGGGGGGYYTSTSNLNERGGPGGGVTGGNGFYSNASTNTSWVGSGGTATSGGSRGTSGNGTNGSFGFGGQAASNCCTYGSGGGGGGWYGGGGSYYAGGGGGSSYANPSFTTGVTHTQGVQNGAGQIVLSWNAEICNGPRQVVPVLVNDTVLPPVVGGYQLTCGFSATLSASGSSGHFRWYNQSTAGVAMSTDSTLSTGNLFSSTTYYVEATSVPNAPYCVSPRVAVMVDVVPVLNPVPVGDTVICGNALTLSVSGSTGMYHWYTTPTGGTPIDTSSQLQVTPFSNTTYYVEATSDNNPSGSQVFQFTGSVQQFTVPAGVTSIQVDVRGAQGGTFNTSYGIGGRGGRIVANVPVIPGQQIGVYVGGTTNTHSGGWNGGGSCNNTHVNMRGGGGASDIRIGGSTLNNRIVVAAGGGGSGGPNAGNVHGGGGGTITGQDGQHNGGFNATYSGRGGGQTAGGTSGNAGANGSFGLGGTGIYSSTAYGAGGGGGGWYGGGGGNQRGGGGGGSNYINPSATLVTQSQGFQLGNGQVIISWTKQVCTSQRIAVNAVVMDLPSPVVSDDTVSCSSSATLSATGGSGNYRWYSQPLGGQPFAQGSILATAPVFQSTVYYVESFLPGNTCLSPRIPVMVNVDSLPLPVLLGNDTLCDIGSAVFTVSGGIGAYVWYDSPVGSIIGNGSTYSTGSQTSSVVVYVRSENGPCSSPFAQGVLMVTPTPNANIVSPDTVCAGDGLQMLIAGNMGGLWQGSGISDSLLGYFDPAQAIIGSNQVVYQITQNLCSASDTVEIEVRPGPIASIFDPGVVCENQPPIVLSVLNSGGVWNGIGITDTVSGVFDPSASTVGQSMVVYSMSAMGCFSSDTLLLTINPIPDASIVPPAPVCSNAGVFALNASNVGGQYSGQGIVNGLLGLFDPSLVSVGFSPVLYTLTENGCTQTDSVLVQVLLSPDATILSPSSYCSNQSIVALQSATMGGFWSGVGVSNGILGIFDPQLTPLGNHIITYEVNLNGCVDYDTLAIQVSQAPDATITNFPNEICANASMVLLNSLFPGGVWSGPGIVDSLQGMIHPQQLFLGPNTISYQMLQNGCSDQQSVTIMSLLSPDATILGAPLIACENDAEYILNAVSPGGFWTGPGIMNALNGSFSPGFAGVGSSTISYSVSNGQCFDSDTIHIAVVAAPTVSVFPSGAQSFCEGSGLTLSASGANGYQWFLDGNAIVGANGAQLNVTSGGSFTVQGTILNCSAIHMDVPITMHPAPQVLQITGLDVCEGLPTLFSGHAVVAQNTGSVITGYLWDFGDGTTGTGLTPLHHYSVAGAYNVALEVTTNKGCKDSLIQSIWVNPNPVISHAAVSDVCEQNTSQFSATANVPSLNNASIVSYVWDFGNGISGSGVNVGHNYVIPGPYSWSLVVTTNHGCSALASGQHVVYKKPMADFIFTEVCTNTPSLFLDVSDPFGDQISSWNWSFGDGVGFSSLQNPQYQYNSPAGLYPVQLTVQTASGCSDTKTQLVSLYQSPNASWQSQVTGPTSALFSPVNPNPNVTFMWHFPHDNTYYYQNQVSKNFLVAGEYLACLTAQQSFCSVSQCSNIVFGQVGIDESEQTGMSIYPNPFEETFSLRLPFEIDAPIALFFYDLAGRLIGSQAIPMRGGDKTSINVNAEELQLPAGAYVLRVSTNKFVWYERVVKID